MSSVFFGNLRSTEDMMLIVAVMMVAVGVHVASKHLWTALARQSGLRCAGEKKAVEEVILAVAKKNTAASAKRRRNRNKARKAEQQRASAHAQTALDEPKPEDSVHYFAPERVLADSDASTSASTAERDQPAPALPTITVCEPTPLPTPRPPTPAPKDESFAALAAVAALAVVADVSVIRERQEPTPVFVERHPAPCAPVQATFAATLADDSDMSVAGSEEDGCDFEGMPQLLSEDVVQWSLFSAEGEHGVQQDAASGWDPLSDVFDTRKALHGLISSYSDASTTSSIRGISSVSSETTVSSARTSVCDADDLGATIESDSEPWFTVSEAPSPPRAKYAYDPILASFFTNNLPLKPYRAQDPFHPSSLPRLHLPVVY